MTTSDIITQNSNCSKCGKCRTACPSFIEERKESFSTRGRIHLANNYAQASTKPSSEFIKAVSTCLFCLRCKTVCPNGVDIEKSILPSRALILDRSGRSVSESLLMQLVVSKRIPLSLFASLMGITESIINFTRLTKPYRTIIEAATGISSKRILPKFSVRHFYGRKKSAITAAGNTKTVIYFPGCSANLVLTNIAESALSLLLRSGSDVLLPRLDCCGMPIYASGDFKLAEKVARKNIEAIKMTGCKTIITSCGSCGSMLGKTYKEILGNEANDIEVFDILTWLGNSNIMPGRNSLNLDVTYHDPCHLKRGMNVYEEPRNLLQSLPGVNYIEMANADSCCGSGGTVSLKHYELSKKIRKNKIHRFQRTKAHVLATGCPACVLNIEDGMAEYGLSTKVLHPIELLNLTYDR